LQESGVWAAFSCDLGFRFGAVRDSLGEVVIARGLGNVEASR
jgi:hypothetical protein